MSWNKTVLCSHCWKTGHNKAGCVKLREEMQKRIDADPEDWYAVQYFEKKNRSKKRTCGYCENEGHNRKTCSEAKQDQGALIQQNRAAREKALTWLKSCGIGVGALVKHETYYSDDIVGLVESVNWTAIDAQRVLVDENGIGVPNSSCLRIAKMDGSKERCNVSPHNVEILGTIPCRLVSAQVPYGWLESTDEATLSEINAELKSNSMRYIRGYILKTEDFSY